MSSHLRAAFDDAYTQEREVWQQYVAGDASWLEYLVALHACRCAAQALVGATTTTTEALSFLQKIINAERSKYTSLACFPECEMVYE